MHLEYKSAVSLVDQTQCGEEETRVDEAKPENKKEDATSSFYSGNPHLSLR